MYWVQEGENTKIIMEEILVIEDEELLNDGLCFHLQKTGYHATPAYCLEQADFLIKKQTWSLFLLDINLPDGSGLQFAEKIRQKSTAPIIFLTAKDMDEDMIRGFEAGAAPVKALDGVDFAVEQGSFTTIVGSSGSRNIERLDYRFLYWAAAL